MQAFPTLGFVSLVIRLSLRPWGAGRAPIMEIYYLLFSGRGESVRALPVSAASQVTSQVTLVWNNQYAIVGYPGAAYPGSQHTLIRKRDTEKKMSHKDTEGHHVITEAEVGMMELQIKELWESVASIRSYEEAKKNSPAQVSEEAWPCQHLDSSLLASRTERINFSCFKTLTLLQQPWETDTLLLPASIHLWKETCI